MTQDFHPKPHPGLPVTNEVRLSLRQWAIVLAFVALVAVATPRIWKQIERFEIGPDYRIPYQLSNDYWLYDWRLEKLAGDPSIVVLGDSVVWGEYVKSDGTLPHFLSQQAGQPDRFVNAGVNGLYPLALEGLVRCYGTSLRQRKVIVVCNLLWLSSPKADMQAKKPGEINHGSLVPQFVPQVPSYGADANERIGAVIGRNVHFFGWVSHLQDCYFQQQSILRWTLAEDPDKPHRYPNSYRDPLAQITLRIPAGDKDDAERGPVSSRHRPWTANGARKTGFDWVTLESSLQWAAFQRTVALLRERGDDVLVIVSPFNEHMVADKSLAAYTAIHSGVEQWLAQEGIPYVAPKKLPSELYADASHPLTAGYQSLAVSIEQSEAFRKWIEKQ